MSEEAATQGKRTPTHPADGESAFRALGLIGDNQSTILCLRGSASISWVISAIESDDLSTDAYDGIAVIECSFEDLVNNQLTATVHFIMRPRNSSDGGFDFEELGAPTERAFVVLNGHRFANARDRARREWDASH